MESGGGVEGGGGGGKMALPSTWPSASPDLPLFTRSRSGAQLARGRLVCVHFTEIIPRKIIYALQHLCRATVSDSLVVVVVVVWQGGAECAL